MTTSSARRDVGSFRDPHSAVFIDGSRVLRGLTEAGAADFDQVASTRFWAKGIADGDVVDTWRLTGDGLDDWAAVLEHTRLPVVTYAFEWPFSMLQDAALLQLRLLRAALSEGITCKDGTAYNVQYVGARPVFIDVGSFQPMEAGESWRGYRQFCQTFLYPLMLEAYLGVAFQPLLRGSLDGIPPALAAGLLRGRARLKPGVLTHVALHAQAERRYGARSGQVAAQLRAAGLSVAVVDAMAGRLEKLVGRLAPANRDTGWTDYTARSHYTADAITAKDRFVSEAVARRRWRLALDLGCNDGRYSLLVAEHAEHVVATDVDAAVIGRLYRRLRASGHANVTPLVLDVADPSPALGWRHRERAAFGDRVRPDLVLSLALVHHLAIGRNIPLADVVDALAAYRATVVVEFPHADDPMVRRLLAGKRGGLHGDFGIETFERLVRDRFAVLRRQQLPGVPRTMFELAPLSG